MKTLHLLTLTLIALLAAPVASFAQFTTGKLPVVEPISVEPPDEPTATCNDPHTKFRNYSTVTVTIKAFQYKSSGCGNKWRTELTPNVTVPPGFYVDYRDDLGGVEGCALVSFKFKYKLGVNTRWSDAITPNEGTSHECWDGGTTYTIDFDDGDL